MASCNVQLCCMPERQRRTTWGKDRCAESGATPAALGGDLGSPMPVLLLALLVRDGGLLWWGLAPARQDAGSHTQNSKSPG